MGVEINTFVELGNELHSCFDNKDGYEIKNGVLWGTANERHTFSYGVKKEKEYVAFIDYLDAELSDFVDVVDKELNYILRKTPAKLYIVHTSDKETYRVGKCENGENKWEEIKEFNSVVEEIKKIGTQQKSEDTNSIKDANILDRINLRFYEKQTKHLDPSWCREQLGKFEGKQICRFSTLDSLFSSIKFETIRLNGLPGMNDASEGLYAWNMLYEDDKAKDLDLLRERKRLLNNAFIVSYSVFDKRDDLNQWRIYGDEAKGVCCVYEIDESKLKDRFFLHKVKYIGKHGEGDNSELLQNFKKYIDDENNKLDYYDLSPVIFYYKPSVFKDEEEVRLLVDNKTTPAYETPPYKRDWLLTNSNNIPNPYIDVPFNDVPLILKEIILGPSMNDALTIQAQLEELLSQNGFTDVKVTRSGIDSYRKPND